MILPDYTIGNRGHGTARSGVSLMEVLISIFVISIGLLGIAALIPVANYALMETSKADRTAACGQAAIREVSARRLVQLVYDTEETNPALNPLLSLLAGNTIVVDPLLFASGANRPYFGETNLRRARLYTQARLLDQTITQAMAPAVAERIFYWHDDLLFDMREDSSLRPVGFDVNNDDVPDGPIAERGYSWFFTVTPFALDGSLGAAGGSIAPQYFTVSVVVCQGRDFATAEQSQDITVPAVGGLLRTRTPAGTIISGLRVTNRPDLEPGQWVMLYGPNESGTVYVAQWYRIAAGSNDYFALEGPNWPSLGDVNKLPIRVITMPGVLGVYTRTVGLQ